jgi:hypothetical protein
MVLCLDSDVLEVIITNDTIKGFASKKKRKYYLL